MVDFAARKILGELVFLRPLHKADAEPFLEAVEGSRESLSEFLPWPADVQNLNAAQTHIEAYSFQAKLGNGGAWGIFEQASGKFSGAIYVHWISEENSSAAIGYWLSKAARGNGFATEAVKLICKTLLLEWRLNRIEAMVPVENRRSLSVLERAGFASEGVCREYAKLHGKFHDCVRFCFLRKFFGGKEVQTEPGEAAP